MRFERLHVALQHTLECSHLQFTAVLKTERQAAATGLARKLTRRAAA
jgi:hypothetical protein